MVRSVHIGSLAAHNAHTGGAARTQRFSVAAPVVFLLIRVFTFLFVITQKKKRDTAQAARLFPAGSLHHGQSLPQVKAHLIRLIPTPGTIRSHTNGASSGNKR